MMQTPSIAPAMIAAFLIGVHTPALADARFDYLLHCGGCHLEDGSGNPPEVPDLRENFDWLAGFAEGRSYLTRVPGASQVPLSDEALAGVFNWILESFYAAGGDVAPFSGEEIARTRYLPLFDPLKARAALATAADRPPR